MAGAGSACGCGGWVWARVLCCLSAAWWFAQVVTFISERLRGGAISESGVVAATQALCDHARTLWLEEGSRGHGMAAQFARFVNEATDIELVATAYPPEAVRRPST